MTNEGSTQDAASVVDASAKESVKEVDSAPPPQGQREKLDAINSAVQQAEADNVQLEVVNVDKQHQVAVTADVTIVALMLAEAAVLLKNANARHIYSSMQMHIDPNGITVQGVYHGKAMHELVTWQDLHLHGSDYEGIEHDADHNILIEAIHKVRDVLMAAG